MFGSLPRAELRNKEKHTRIRFEPNKPCIYESKLKQSIYIYKNIKLDAFLLVFRQKEAAACSKEVTLVSVLKLKQSK